MIEGKSKMLNESDNRIPLDDEQIPNGTRFLKMKNIGMLKQVYCLYIQAVLQLPA